MGGAGTTDHGSALLDALFAHAPIGLAFWDEGLRFRRINEALATINGPPREEHLGRTPQEVLGPLGDDVAALIERVLRTGEPVTDVELTGETPAAPGVERAWLVSYYPVPATASAGGGVGAIVLEVTSERRATERARQAVRERRTTTALLDAIFAAAPVGLGYWDLEGRYQRVNAALAELNDLSEEEHLGRTPAEVLGPLGEQVLVAIREVLATGAAVVDREMSGEARRGVQGYRQGTWFPVHGPDGEVAGVGGVIRDVTAQHEADEERARLLTDALSARAHAEAAQVRAEHAKAETDRARVRTEFLARAGEQLALVTQDYERTLQEVARVAVPVMADWCTFTLTERRGLLRTAAVAALDPELEAEALELSHRYPPRLDAPAGAGQVIRTGEPVLVEEVPEGLIETIAQDEQQLAFLRRAGLRSGLTVPLNVRGRTIGALSLVYSTSGRRYGPDDVTLAESLAVRAALAVENARLLAERSHIAQTLQRSLLPPALPDIPGLDLAARYRAAGDQNEVGGDFYDVFRAADGVWTFVIGDVSGKGAEAAAVTSLTRHTLRAAALRDTAPAETLQLLNEALLSQPDPAGRFCTVLVARVCPAQDGGVGLTLATGGHLPPMVVRSGGRVERIQLRGSLVGGLDRPHFGERDLHLDPGDLLVMFTDGVTEIRSTDPDFGEAALEEVLLTHRLEGVDEIVAAVEDNAVGLQAGEPRDDIALLALRARP